MVKSFYLSIFNRGKARLTSAHMLTVYFTTNSIRTLLSISLDLHFKIQVHLVNKPTITDLVIKNDSYAFMPELSSQGYDIT